jgi:hypothetical protein
LWTFFHGVDNFFGTGLFFVGLSGGSYGNGRVNMGIVFFQYI